MSESLKAARERVADEIYDRACEMYEAHKGRQATEDIAGALREVMKLSMEALLADLEYEQRPDGGWRGVAWTSLAVGYVDALLDGPAPGEGE